VNGEPRRLPDDATAAELLAAPAAEAGMPERPPRIEVVVAVGEAEEQYTSRTLRWSGGCREMSTATEAARVYAIRFGDKPVIEGRPAAQR
jgi:hypothetical protein